MNSFMRFLRRPKPTVWTYVLGAASFGLLVIHYAQKAFN